MNKIGISYAYWSENWDADPLPMRAALSLRRTHCVARRAVGV